MSVPRDPEADIALMLLVRGGDERAFARLYDRNYRAIQRFFFSLSRDVTVSYDLCQETFVRIWRARHRYAATGTFKAYLYTFARHIWLEQCRRVRKERMLGLASHIEDYFDSLAAPSSGEPDGLAVRAESRASIEAALDELPEEQRLAFTLRYMQGLSPEEIARVMDCPVNTVRSRKLAALRKLRELLQSRRSQEIEI